MDRFPQRVQGAVSIPGGLTIVLRAVFWIGFLLVTGSQSGCGSGDEFNLYSLVSKPTIGKTKGARTEEARVYLDQKEYRQAINLLEPMLESDKEDSNVVRLLYAAATLGEAKLDLWSLISSFLDGQSQPTSAKGSSKATSGMDDFLDTLSAAMFGTAEETASKTAALTHTVNVLKEAPMPAERAIRNTACIFGALLAVPSFTAAKTAVEATNSALAAISATATGDGSNCPDIGLLDSALTNAQTAATQFAAVLSAAENCPFLNTSDTQGSLNSIEAQLAKLTSGADKGCAGIPSCPTSFPNCDSLFPTCVQTALNHAGGTAGDGVISSCELTRNCLVGGDCF